MDFEKISFSIIFLSSNDQNLILLAEESVCCIFEKSILDFSRFDLTD